MGNTARAIGAGFVFAKVRSEEGGVRSGGAAHKLRSAASLESQRAHLLPHYREPFTV